MWSSNTWPTTPAAPTSTHVLCMLILASGFVRAGPMAMQLLHKGQQLVNHVAFNFMCELASTLVVCQIKRATGTVGALGKHQSAVQQLWTAWAGTEVASWTAFLVVVSAFDNPIKGIDYDGVYSPVGCFIIDTKHHYHHHYTYIIHTCCKWNESEWSASWCFSCCQLYVLVNDTRFIEAQQPTACMCSRQGRHTAACLTLANAALARQSTIGYISSVDLLLLLLHVALEKLIIICYHSYTGINVKETENCISNMLLRTL